MINIDGTILVMHPDAALRRQREQSAPIDSGAANLPVCLILGPSGVGKSDFGKWLEATEKWIHLEADKHPFDGIDKLGLRVEWNEFYEKCGSCAPLVRKVQQRAVSQGSVGCVLTFPSNLVLEVDRISEARRTGALVVYLYGTKPQCFRKFLQRERRKSSSLGRDHWCKNNTLVFERLSESAFAEHVIRVFTVDGGRMPHDAVYLALHDRR